ADRATSPPGRAGTAAHEDGESRACKEALPVTNVGRALRLHQGTGLGPARPLPSRPTVSGRGRGSVRLMDIDGSGRMSVVQRRQGLSPWAKRVLVPTARARPLP